MAENKAGIIVYADWITTFEALSDDEAGRLIKHFFQYVNDMNPVAPDRLTALMFEPIKAVLKRDLKKYEQRCQKNAENIGKRWNKETTIVYDRIPARTKHTDNDSDSDSDSDNGIDNKEIDNYRTQFEVFRKRYPGSKRGTDTEFDNLKKKHKDYKAVIPILIDSLNKQIETRIKLKDRAMFVPEWKHLQTWINQRCWEEEIEVEKTKIFLQR